MTELQALMLKSIQDAGLCHGLAVGRAVDAILGKTTGVGTIYKNLHALERDGYVTSEWETDRDEARSGPNRRYYKISGLGAQALDDYRVELVRIAKAHGLRPRLA